MSAEQASLESYREELTQTLRDVGAQTALALDPDWREAAAEAIAELARSGEIFDAEDVRLLAGDPPSPNALGGAFLAARQSGLIEATGFRQAKRIQRHGSWLRTWRGRHGS
jgi:hypothetical protein